MIRKLEFSSAFNIPVLQVLQQLLPLPHQRQVRAAPGQEGSGTQLFLELKALESQEALGPKRHESSINCEGV